MTTMVGIDIAKAKFDVALLRQDGGIDYGQFDNTPKGFKQFKTWLDKRRSDTVHACMEATGLYSNDLALFLHQHDYSVSVVNPARISAYAKSLLRRNKTDKLDAALIADFCRTQSPPAWNPPDPDWLELQSLARHLEDLEQTRQQQRNRLGSGVRTPLVREQLQRHIALLDEQIDQLKRHVQNHLDQHPDLRQQKELLTSIPGIADLTAGKLLAQIPNIRAFDDPRQLVAFAGLNPAQHQSGKAHRSKTPISKQGHASLRAALFMPAVSAKQHNPILHAFAQRLTDRGLCGLEVVVAVMRKLLHLIFGILKSGQPFDPHFRSHLDFSA